MSSLLFWKEWSRPYRLTYLFTLGLFFVSILLFATAWVRGLDNVVRWDVLSELNQLPVTIRTFTDGLFDFAVPGKAYAVSEQFVASAMQVHPALATWLLVGIATSFVLLLSALTRFDRLRYLIGMGLLILGLAFFRWEMLEVPGLGGNYLFLLLTFAVGSLSYYFHAFRPDHRIYVRLAAFGGLTVLIALGLWALSPVQFPALTVVSYGMPVLLVFSVGFIFFIAPEIVAGLVWLTTVGRTDNDVTDSQTRRTLGVRNFLVISTLYLVNLTLIWLKNTKSIDWDVLAISPFLLYLTSVLVGVWGFRRLIQQQDVVSFRDGGAFLYAGLALLTTLTMGYAFATANDPIVELFEDVIVYTHLAMGVFFVVYVLINFWPIYQQHRAVYRILYKPRRLELSLFRVAGVFGVVVLLASGGLITVRQGVAGYYNGLGDLYVASGEPNSANAFYQLALEQEFQNHKSNYALASLAVAQNNSTTAAYYFQQATLKQPDPHDYAGLSQIYLQTNLFFEAIKTLQRGLRVFPKSGELRNNLGYLYARTSVADSAYYYLKTATDYARRSEVPEANLLALYARNPQVLAADSTLGQTVESDYVSYQANALALRQVTGQRQPPARRPAWLSDTSTDSVGLSVGRFASLYNYVGNVTQPDTVLTRKIRQLNTNPANQDFTDDLLLTLALTKYNQHDYTTAFGVLEQLAEGGSSAQAGAATLADLQNSKLYRTMAGLLLMEQGLYRKAVEQFSFSNDTTASYYQAMALTKAGDPALAQGFWEKAARNDPNVAALKAVLYDERKPQNDLEKAFYVVYRPDDLNRGRYWETIQDPSQKTVAGVALANTYLDDVQWRNTHLMLSGLPDTSLVSDFAVSLRSLAAVRLSAFRRSVGSAETMARQGILPEHRARCDYWLAQTYERTRQPNKARSAYRRALQLAPLDARIATSMAQLNRQRGQIKPAYEAVLTALPFNDDNAELLKTYVTLCLDQSLFDYARNGLDKLQAVTLPADYQAFVTTYQEKVAAVEKDRQKFAE